MCKIFCPESRLSSDWPKDLRSKSTLFERSVKMFSGSAFPPESVLMSLGLNLVQVGNRAKHPHRAVIAHLCRARKRSGYKPVLPELTKHPSFRYKSKEAVSCPSKREKRSCFPTLPSPSPVLSQMMASFRNLRELDLWPWCLSC